MRKFFFIIDFFLIEESEKNFRDSENWLKMLHSEQAFYNLSKNVFSCQQLPQWPTLQFSLASATKCGLQQHVLSPTRLNPDHDLEPRPKLSVTSQLVISSVVLSMFLYRLLTKKSRNMTTYECFRKGDLDAIQPYY